MRGVLLGLVAVGVVACAGGCGRRNFNTGEGADAAVVTSGANLMFVTAEVHAGDLGGLAGADAICDAAALAAGLPGTYVAWLSTATVAAASRLAGARGWIRTDGEVVVDRPTELTSQGPRVPMSFTEDGVDLRALGGPVSVFTGSTGQGQARGVRCADWTSADGTAIGGVGNAVRGGGEFAFFSTASDVFCAAAQHLYCFGVDHVVVLDAPVPAPAPRAFVSRGTFASSTGRPVADAMCATEAADAGLVGAFVAAIPLAGETTASRFITSGLYHRTDGVLLGRILGEPVPHTFLNRHADGSVAPAGSVWTAGSPTRTADATDTCDGWSASTGTADLGDSAAATAEMFAATGYTSCEAGYPVYCLEN